MAFLESAAVAFGLILLAEIGDKTQLVLITLAMRGQRLRLFLGAALAFALLTGVAVVAADLLRRVLSPLWIGLIGGGLFLVFGLLTLREGITGEEEEQIDVETQPSKVRGALFGSFLLVGAAELGDKTQIAVAVLAADSGEPLAVGIGAWLALTLLGGLALLLGGILARHIPQRTIRIIAGVLFLVVGVFLIVAGIRGVGGPLVTLMGG